MILSVPNPVSYYPLEKWSSYLRRLCTANHMDYDLTLRALRQGCLLMGKHDRDEIVTERCEAIGGLAPGAIARADDPKTTRPAPRGCYQCEREKRPRWLCLQCAQGETVEQIAHNQTTLCLRHRRWTAPGVPPTLHVRVDHPDMIRAERNYRSAMLGTCPTNVHIARRIAADWASHCDPKVVERRRRALTRRQLPDQLIDEIHSYPEAVTIMTLFADSSWITDILVAPHSYTDIRDAVTQRLRRKIPEHPDHIAALVMHELRPAIARYYYRHGPYRHHAERGKPIEIPIWHHDIEFDIPTATS